MESKKAKVTGEVFEIDGKQYKKYLRWRKKLKPLAPEYHTADGGATTFCFTPTGLGLLIEVKRIDGEKLDLTDWKNF